MANSLLTPKQLRDLVVVTVRQGRNPEWDQGDMMTGWNIDYNGEYVGMRLYDRSFCAERWRHIFKGAELCSVSQMTTIAFAEYLIETWPDVFAPAPEPELNIRLKEEWDKLTALSAVAEKAMNAVAEQRVFVSELLGKL